VTVKTINILRRFIKNPADVVTGVVGLSGGAYNGSTSCKLSVNADGTVDKIVDGVTTQVNTTVDWVIPNAAFVEAAYSVKFHQTTGDPFQLDPGQDVELLLSSDRIIGFTSFGKAGIVTVSIIRLGVVIASADYTLGTIPA